MDGWGDRGWRMEDGIFRGYGWGSTEMRLRRVTVTTRRVGGGMIGLCAALQPALGTLLGHGGEAAANASEERERERDAVQPST